MAKYVFEINRFESKVNALVLCEDIKCRLRTAGFLTYSCRPDDPIDMTTITVDAIGSPEHNDVAVHVIRCLDETPGVSYASFK